MARWIGSADTERGVTTSPPDPQATALDAYFLDRLYRLIDLNARPDLDPTQRRLVHRAMYSTYWDCVGLGLQSTATPILDLPPQQKGLALR